MPVIDGHSSDLLEDELEGAEDTNEIVDVINIVKMDTNNGNKDTNESKVYDETTQLEKEDDLTQLSCNPINSILQSQPSSPLIYNYEETQLTCDRLFINTQELEKLAAINDSIDKELAELEKKLATSSNSKENINVEDFNFIPKVKRTESKPLTESKLLALSKMADPISYSSPKTSKIISPRSAKVIDFTDKSSKVSKLSKDTTEMKPTVKTIRVSKRETKSIPTESTATSPDYSTLTESVSAVKVQLKTIETLSDSKSSSGKIKICSSNSKSTKRTSLNSKTTTASNKAEGIKNISTTGIKDEKSILQLTKFNDTFNCSISPDSPYLIVPTGPGLIVKKRTMKYFEAILLKKEIISFDWIDACLKAGKIISISEYLIKGDQLGKRSNSKSNLFTSSHKIYLYGAFNQPPRDQLEQLIRLTNSPILEDVNELTRGSIVLADPSSQFTFEKDAQVIKKYPIVSPNWLLDSISCGKVLDFSGYLIL